MTEDSEAPAPAASLTPAAVTTIRRRSLGMKPSRTPLTPANRPFKSPLVQSNGLSDEDDDFTPGNKKRRKRKAVIKQPIVCCCFFSLLVLNVLDVPKH